MNWKTKIGVFCLVALGGGAVFSPIQSFSGESKNECDGDGYSYYYGIGKDQDFKKALACYEQEKNQVMQIVIYLNGDGLPRNLGKAEAVFKHMDRELNPLQYDAVKEALDQRRGSPPDHWKPVSYCENFAMTTPEMNDCAELARETQERKSEKKLAQYKKGLSAEQIGLFNKMIAAFQRFRELEGERMLQRNAGGSNYVMASKEQMNFVEDNFQRDLKKIILEPHD
jgi:hypothetical protein